MFLLAFCLSIGVSYPLAGQIGKRLYNDSVVKTEQRLEEETSFSFDRPIDMDVVDVDVQLNMELNPPAVLAAGGMGLLIVALSALILSGDCKMQAQGTADRDGVRKQFA